MTGKRVQGRRVADAPRETKPSVSPLVVVGLVLGLVTVGALALQKPANDPAEVATDTPSSRPLTRLDLLCPADDDGDAEVVLGSGADGEASYGEVSVRDADSDNSKQLDVSAGGAAPVSASSKAVVVTGTRGLAPGLFGARFGSADRPAAGECVAPTGERWFVGVGGGGLHESQLVLANPDTGPAVADVSLWSSTGELIDVDSRGLTIPGQRSSVLDLAALAPNRDELSIRVTVSRGRVAASMSDTYTPRGGEQVSDWLPSTTAPATQLLLPGLPRRMTEPTLVLANPGEDAGQVGIKVVGRDSTFAPSGVDEIKVPAGQSVTTELPASLVRLLAQEDTALQLTSSVPVVGSLRAVVAGDLVHIPAVEPSSGDAAAAAPGGPGSVLVLTAGSAAGPVKVDFPGTDAEPVAVRLRPGVTTTVPVPEKATAAVVHGSTDYVGSLRTITANGASLLPLRPLQLETLIPAVRPDWP
ncbi:hypothetical protein ncot_04515 [Nocardioides sp. JQ2195]|uniref:DUF5719 family protein n=1 Tax=Nocardioides sp. JQ2195 TaxID=2592334 RepID=UPI00143ECC8B|nr:DUF5719 family protein [Nocardioides sp. JQ2195]QIX25944.1 hypothetical protein ncot_04515 [Nocardioides sp. JQ2195]